MLNNLSEKSQVEYLVSTLNKENINFLLKVLKFNNNVADSDHIVLEFDNAQNKALEKKSWGWIVP